MEVTKEFEKLYKAVIQDDKLTERYREYFWILQRIKNYKDKKILDAGCGLSPLPFFFAVNGAKVYGVDTKWKFDSPEELAFYSLFSLYPQYSLSFVNCDLVDTPFKDKYFDYIVCTSVFQSVKIDKWTEIVTEFERILKGYLLITVNYKYTKRRFPLNYKKLKLIEKKEEKALRIFTFSI